jgi:hypothetical protein
VGSVASTSLLRSQRERRPATYSSAGSSHLQGTWVTAPTPNLDPVAHDSGQDDGGGARRGRDGDRGAAAEAA